jgi:Tfp pilus assembly protein PilW
MITSRSSFSRSGRGSPGFTLVEVLIAASLATMILAGVLSASMMMMRSGVRAANYSTMESESRRAFEQLGIDARMANLVISNFTGGVISSITFSVPSQDLQTQSKVTYGYDTTNHQLFMVPGNDPTVTTGRLNLVNNVTTLTFNRYNAAGTAIAAATTSDVGVRHIQVSISISRAASGVAAATQVIRSTAFTIRNTNQ